MAAIRLARRAHHEIVSPVPVDVAGQAKCLSARTGECCAERAVGQWPADTRDSRTVYDITAPCGRQLGEVDVRKRSGWSLAEDYVHTATDPWPDPGCSVWRSDRDVADAVAVNVSDRCDRRSRALKALRTIDSVVAAARRTQRDLVGAGRVGTRHYVDRTRIHAQVVVCPRCAYRIVVDAVARHVADCGYCGPKLVSSCLADDLRASGRCESETLRRQLGELLDIDNNSIGVGVARLIFGRDLNSSRPRVKERWSE